MNKVAITKCSVNNIEEKVRESINLIGGIESYIKENDVVLIKPNVLCAQNHETGATTSPVLVKELCKMCFEAGAKKVVVGESSNWGIDSMQSMLACGFGIVTDTGAELLDLKKDEIVRVPTKTGIVRDYVHVPEITQTADKIINVPVFKTHTMTKVTLAIKNISVGISPDKDKQHSLHRIGVYPALKNEIEEMGSFLDCAMVDINSVVRNDLIVIDGIYGLHGKGAPLFGVQINSNILISGNNKVSVDAIGAQLLGYDPYEVKHIKTAYEKGLGEIDSSKFELLGEKVEDFNFDIQNSFNVDLKDIPPNFTIVNGCENCKACLSTVNYVSSRHKEEFSKLGPVTIFVGKYFKDEKPKNERRKLIYYGNCAVSHIYGGGAVPGCPPRSRRQFMQALGVLDLYVADEGLKTDR